MKIADQKEYIYRSNDMPVVNFQIKASAKAFKILSSSLYSNKILAVIRELSTNAYDSHVVNGNPEKPFDVHLPTGLENTFYIRDYGTGIEPEKIKTVYTVYFESDKTESNDLNGCLGLGSKSPFSYTKAFTVENFYNSKLYIYSSYLNEYGEPEMVLLDTQDTNKPNGIKVSIAVETDDIHKFTNEAALIYKRFKVKPNFTGAVPAIIENKVVLNGDDWRLLDGGSVAYAVMGNIAYPISFSGDNAVINSFQSCPIEIDFPIGSLDIEAGRESLSYDKGTIARLKLKIQEVVEKIRDKSTNLVADCKNLYEARRKFMAYNRSIRSLNALIDNKLIKFQNQQLFDDDLYGHQISLHKLEVNPVLFIKNWRDKSEKKIISSVDFNEEHIYVDADLKIGNIVRCQQYVRNTGKKVILVDLTDPAKRQLFLDKIGFDESYLVKASTLDYVRIVTERQKSISLAEYKYSSYTTKCWKETTKTIAEGGIYVVTEHGSIRNASGELIHANNIECVITGLKSLDINLDIVYGIKKHLIPEVIEAGNWVNLWDYLKEELDSISKNIITQINNGKAIDNLDYYTKNRITFYNRLAPHVSDVNIKEIIKKYKELTAKKRLESHQIRNIQTLFSLVNIPLNLSESTKNYLEKIDADIIMTYPLIEHVSTSSDDKVIVKEIAKYISLQENYNG